MMRNYIVLIFHALFVLCSNVGFNSATENGDTKCNERDKHALLTFKQGLQDEFGTLYTWKDDPNADCCKWMGVRCNNETGYVQSLDLHGSETNYLSGEINPSITELQHLKYLDLSYLYISCQIPRFILNICTLETFAADFNNLSGDFSDFIIHNNYSHCIGNVSSLQVLSLSNNQISGMLPDLSVFPSLRILNLASNKLIGEIPSSIRSLTKLEMLILSKNFFQGVISEYHFTNFSKLEYLYLSYNSLTIKVSDDWVPPFQLQELDLSYCNMDSRFPNWLQIQNNLSFLYLSNVGSLPPMPSWFWSKLQTLVSMTISNNNLTGRIPNLEINLTNYPEIDLSSNQLEGAIPSFLLQAAALHLSNNKISDLASFLCSKSKPNILEVLDLSNNQLNGELPDCWNNLSSLQFIDLSNNKLSGNIPFSMNALVNIEALILRNNSLTGQITPALKNCSKNMAFLDLGENMFHGIGDSLDQLVILNLRFNNFNGSMPLNLCYLRKLHVLDLSLNSLSGQMPTCVKNFTSMAHDIMNSTTSMEHSYIFNNRYFNVQYNFYLFFMWKGVDQLYKNADMFLKSIDLSSNHLTGKIPTEMGYLFGLISLNLSRNNLCGEIISNIGNFKSLEFLDLSRNHLSGRIPSSLAHIDRLTWLDLTNNQLYGKIPIGTQLQTFDTSSFDGNFNLWKTS